MVVAASTFPTFFSISVGILCPSQDVGCGRSGRTEVWQSRTDLRLYQILFPAAVSINITMNISLVHAFFSFDPRWMKQCLPPPPPRIPKLTPFPVGPPDSVAIVVSSVRYNPTLSVSSCLSPDWSRVTVLCMTCPHNPGYIIFSLCHPLQLSLWSACLIAPLSVHLLSVL